MMNIYLTFDYELYFGKNTGTAERCITGPTQMLADMTEKYGVKMVHFVDVGYLLKLKEFKNKYTNVDAEYNLVSKQLESLYRNGHDIQLHIHPHWEDSFYDGEKWVINADRYKLNDFSAAEVMDIVSRYKKELETYTGEGNIYAYRAGGWCLQPFSHIKNALSTNGIKVESSVFANGCFQSEQYSYNFQGAPLKCIWKFEDDPLIENPEGSFTELPITSIFNSPLFYWRLFLLGRLNPYDHKPLGDGIPIAAPGQRFAMLSRWTHNTVSVDGYNASLLNRALRQQIRRKSENMVIIGHPKALSRYGLDALEKFIRKHKESHNFTTFREEKNKF